MYALSTVYCLRARTNCELRVEYAGQRFLYLLPTTATLAKLHTPGLHRKTGLLYPCTLLVEWSMSLWLKTQHIHHQAFLLSSSYAQLRFTMPTASFLRGGGE